MKIRKTMYCLWILAMGLLLTCVECFSSQSHESLASGIYEIPWARIAAQTFNVTALIFGLWYFLRRTVGQHFESRRATYLEMAEKSKKTLREAQQAHLELKVKLERLKSTAEESILLAEDEARKVKAQLISEAFDLSRRIQHESEQIVSTEIKRAAKAIREEMFDSAVKIAEKTFQETPLSPNDKARLESEFVVEMGRGGKS